MRRVILVLVFLILFYQIEASPTIVSVSSNGVTLKNESYFIAFPSLEFRAKVNNFEVGYLATTAKGALLANPYNYNFSNKATSLKGKVTNPQTLSFNYKGFQLLFFLTKRQGVCLEYSSPYFFVQLSYFDKLKREEHSFTPMLTTKANAIGRTSTGLTTKYLSLFFTLDYSPPLSFSLLGGGRVEYHNYFIEYFYGNCFTTLDPLSYKKQLNFGYKDSHLEVKHSFKWGMDPIFCEEYRRKEYEYLAKVNLNCFTISSSGKRKFTSKGYYNITNQVQLETKHYAILYDYKTLSLSMKAKYLTLSYSKGVTTVKGQYKISNSRTLSFSISSKEIFTLAFSFQI